VPVQTESLGEGLEAVCLARPEKRNALDLEMVAQLLDAIPADPPNDRRAYLLFGEGTAFCAGADRQLVQPGGEEPEELRHRLYQLHHRLYQQPLPLVAWINGPAIGAGALIAILCDVRLVAEGARLAIPAGGLGITLSSWLVGIIVREMGAAMARALLLAGNTLDRASLLASAFAAAPIDNREDAIVRALAVARQPPAVAQAHRLALQGPPEARQGP
jgi:enoyl-CoA hydratase